MVYSIFYYASEALTRALVAFILKIYEYMQRRKRVIVRKKEEKEKAPTWGFFTSINPYGEREYVWVGRSTNLIISIPELTGRLPIKAHETARPPTRLYFTFKEAASKDWFKEIEWLAEQAEKRAGKAG